MTKICENAIIMITIPGFSEVGIVMEAAISGKPQIMVKEQIIMRQIITVNEDKCVGCNACVRVCPVHANATRLREGSTDEFVTTVNYTACINCGECVKVCMHDARGYNDDIDVFTKAFEAKQSIIVIAAPSIRTSFPKSRWRVLLGWLRDNSGAKIYDVAFGADICTFMHNQYMLKHPNAKVVTQTCPAVVNYVQMYQPNLIKYLSPVMSPAACLATYLRKYKHLTEPIYMLSPCIAKTSEAAREEVLDYNVTFRHLEKFANEHGIKWDAAPSFSFDESVEGTIGRLYPMPGGFRDTMQILNQDLVIRTAEGPHTLYDRLERYTKTEDRRKPDILDVLNCEFGCNQGTAAPSTVANLMEVESAMDSVAAQSMKQTQGGLLGFGRMKRFKDFDKMLQLEDFMTSYKDEHVQYQAPTVADYNRIFKTMHKEDEASQNINCSACGYKTCHDMACAIFRGMNVRESCIYYLKHSLKDSYGKLKEIYDSTVEDVSKINAISSEMQGSQNGILAAADEIGTKAKELSGNISRLQKFSQSCLEYYKGKKAEDLTEEDFNKMQQFVSAIGTMTKSYYEVANEFEIQSDAIHEQTLNLSAAIDALAEMSDTMEETVASEEEEQVNV